MAVYSRLIPSTDPRLGRHVAHDSRSLRYAAPVLPRSALVSQHWTRRSPILDQGSIGSCCGNAVAGWLATDTLDRQGRADVTEATALDLYHRATVLDEFDGVWEPDDTGSSGLGAAKALQQTGQCGAYAHAFTLQALTSALQSGPALIGISWYESMFDPDGDGRIRVLSSSGLAGGHELLVDQVDVQGGVPMKVWVTNSWGTGWGVEGRGWLTASDLAWLLADDGDVTMPSTPAPPADADRTFAAALHPWVAYRHTGGNETAATAARTWLAERGL